MTGAQFAALLLTGTLSLAPLWAQLEATTETSPDTPEKTYLVTRRVIDDFTGDPLAGAIVQLSAAGLRASCGNCEIPPAPRKPIFREEVTGPDRWLRIR
jgi:hypothetical protein